MRVGTEINVARATGFFYLLVIIAAFYSSVGLLDPLIDFQSADRTAQVVLSHQAQYRFGVLIGMISFVAYCGVTVLLYGLLRPAGVIASRLAVSFILIGSGLGAALSLVQLLALRLEVVHQPILALTALKLYGDGYDVVLVFSGFYCALLGWLIWRSRRIPKFLGGLLIIAGGAYLAGNVADLLGISLPGPGAAWLLPGLVAESLLTIWLIVMGVDQPSIRRSETAEAV